MTVGPFDPLLAQPTRLQIVALLFRNRQAAATEMARALSLTPGNLASHVAKLEEAGYVATSRALVSSAVVRRWLGTDTPAGGAGFQVRHRITPAGDAAFRAHARALQDLVSTALAAQKTATFDVP